MDYFHRLSLKRKLVALLLLQSISVISILILLYQGTEASIYHEFERQVADLSKGIQKGIEEATRSGHPEKNRLQNYLRELQTKGVKEISIISNSDKIIASTDPKIVGKWITRAKKELIFTAERGQPVVGKGDFYNLIVPVVVDSRHYGYIHLSVSIKELSARIQTRQIRRITSIAAILGIGLLLSIILAKRYTRPIEEVVQAVRNVARGDLDQEMHTHRKDEIGELTDSFNEMIGKLKEERVLKERLRKAEQLAGLGQFSLSIAHEIRNPLNLISLSIDRIRKKYGPQDEDARLEFSSLIGNIKAEIDRVSLFAESFLEFSRPLELNLQEMDIAMLIRDVLELVRFKAEADRVAIRTHLGSVPHVKLDPGLIKTCLYNIVLNAFQAMPEGGQITINTEKADDLVRISIKDTGIGLPPEKIAKIFNPFFTTKRYGIGIGLAFTKRVVDEHRGKIEFKSVEGQGSTVTLSLPMVRGE